MTQTAGSQIDSGHAWPDKPVLVGRDRGFEAFPDGGFATTPYANPSEAVLLIRLALMERFYRQVESVRTVESGVVEEHAVVAVEDDRRILIVRIWPVFFADPKRVEYRFHFNRPDITAEVLTYLGLLAKANYAVLVEKT